jgi:hypothetical protein
MSNPKQISIGKMEEFAGIVEERTGAAFRSFEYNECNSMRMRTNTNSNVPGLLLRAQ